MNSRQQNLRITQLIYVWINSYLQSESSVNKNTARNYEITLQLFLDFLGSVKGVTGKTISPNNFSVQIIEEWINWLEKTRGNSPSTCNGRLSSLRSFLEYVAREEPKFAFLFQSSKTIPLRKAQKKKIISISKTALKALLSIPDQGNRTGRMYLSLFVTMYNTGTRLDELLSLTIKHLHINAPNPYLTVIGKGNKIRTLYILPRTVKLLKMYMREFHGNNPNPDNYVFFSRNKGPAGKISQVAVNKQLKKYASIAHEICPDVPNSMHCHQIRHTAATHWLENGMNIVQISTLLGHSNLETSMIYLDVSLEMKANALKKIEDPEIANISKKWGKEKSLAESLGLRTKKRQSVFT